MSLDLTLKDIKCEHCGEYEEYDFNLTYNLSPMWYHLFPEDDRMLPIEGLTGFEAEKLLYPALKKALSQKYALLKLEPSNGWGSYGIFIETLEGIIDCCKKHPKGTWRAWR
jgi:hypothetical protein